MKLRISVASCPGAVGFAGEPAAEIAAAGRARIAGDALRTVRFATRPH